MDDAHRLTKRVRELASSHPRFGYRRITALLRTEGWRVNRKRVHRIWRLEGLRVPVKQRKRRRLGSLDGKVMRRSARRHQEIWSYDFVMDQTEDGRRLKILPVVDEYTRECLGIKVARSLTAQDVIATLEKLFQERGAPRYIRSDNGSEFVAHAVKEWLAQSGVETLYIEPGSPWQNAYSESFNSRFRDELLDREVFTSLVEAQVLVEDYRREYNTERPHSSLSYQTPAAFVIAAQHQPQNSVSNVGLLIGGNPRLAGSGVRSFRHVSGFRQLMR